LEKCVIIELKDKKTGKTVKRIGINEEQFNEYLKRKKESGDLGTNNLGRLLQGIFKNTTKTAREKILLITDTGIETETETKHPESMAYFFNNSNYSDIGSKIRVGDSAMPPSREQYNLQGTILGESDAAVYWADGGDYVDITASFSWTEDKTIYEIGLFYQLCGLTNPNYHIVMFDRTVYPEGIFVPAGQVLTITYRIMV